jgi:anti-sigma B factor antagonist
MGRHVDSQVHRLCGPAGAARRDASHPPTRRPIHVLSRSDPRLVDAVSEFRCAVLNDTDAAIVAPEGELDLATAPLLDAELRRLRDEGTRRLVVDLRGLTFIDSSGVHLLLRWARGDRRFSLIPGPQRVQMVLAMTGVVDHLRVERP